MNDEVRVSRLIEDVKKWGLYDNALWNEDGHGKSNKLFVRLLASKLLAEKHLNLLVKDYPELDMEYERVSGLIKDFQDRYLLVTNIKGEE